MECMDFCSDSENTMNSSPSFSVMQRDVASVSSLMVVSSSSPESSVLNPSSLNEGNFDLASPCPIKGSVLPPASPSMLGDSSSSPKSSIVDPSSSNRSVDRASLSSSSSSSVNSLFHEQEAKRQKLQHGNDQKEELIDMDLDFKQRMEEEEKSIMEVEGEEKAKMKAEGWDDPSFLDSVSDDDDNPADLVIYSSDDDDEITRKHFKNFKKQKGGFNHTVPPPASGIGIRPLSFGSVKIP